MKKTKKTKLQLFRRTRELHILDYKTQKKIPHYLDYRNEGYQFYGFVSDDYNGDYIEEPGRECKITGRNIIHNRRNCELVS